MKHLKPRSHCVAVRPRASMYADLRHRASPYVDSEHCIC